MAKTKLVVFTSPADHEAEDVFNHWYNTVHVPQLLEPLDALKSAGPAGHFTRGGHQGQDDTSKSPRTVAFAVEVISEEFPPPPARATGGTS